MANYLYRRMNRELKKIKYRAVGSSVLIIVGVAMYIGLAAMVPIAGSALEEKVDELNLSHYLVHVNDGNESQVQDLSQIDGVRSVEPRLVVNSRVTYQGDGEDQEVAAFLYGIDPSKRPSINMVELYGDDSSYFTGNGSDTLLLERNFAKNAGISVGDPLSMVTITGVHKVTVIGIVMTPEHLFMPVNPQSLLPYPGNLAVAYLPIDWLREAYNFSDDFVNEFQFMFEDGADKATTMDAINTELAGDIILLSTPKEEVYGYRLIKEDLSAGEDFTALFALLFLMIAFFIVYTSFARIVQEQKREIGVLRALGYTRGQVLGSYIYMAMLIGCVSSIVGLIIGIPLGRALGSFYVELMVGSAMKAFAFDLQKYMIGFLFGPITASLACVIAVWGTVTMDPQDAIRGVPRSWRKAKKKKVEGGTKGPARPSKTSYITKYTLKSMKRHKVRTALTVIAIGGAMAMGSMSLVMWASFENALYASVDDYEEWDVILEFSFPLNDTTVSTLTSTHITDSTYISRIGGTWHKGTKEGFALVIGLESGQTLHKYNIDDGRLAHGTNELMVNRKAAEEAGIHKGDTITIDGPLGSQSFTVTALVEDYIGNFFVEMDAIDALAGEKVYAGVYLKTADGMAGTVKKEMLGSPLVTEAQTRDSMTSGLFDMMESYGSMMYIMSLLGVAIAAPTLANIVFVNILERYPEYGQLRAIGYTKGTIAKSIMLELSVIVSGGVILGIPLTYGIIYGFEEMYKEFFPLYETTIYLSDWISYLFMVALIFLIAVLVAIPSIRHVNKMDVAKTVSGGRFG